MSTPGKLQPELQRKLLQMARETIETYVRTREKPVFSVQEPELQYKAGAFVTIKAHGRLRGCIVQVEGIHPLHETIVEMAVAASTQDPRFSPMKENELASMHLEISVMTPLRKIHDSEEIQVGMHGILMRRGFRSGLLLPQVATEHQWDRTTFLEHTCMKAGLAPNDWKDPGTDIYVFSAQVFDERLLDEPEKDVES